MNDYMKSTDEWIDFWVSHEDYAVIEAAATLCDVTIGEFVVHAALVAAQRMVE